MSVNPRFSPWTGSRMTQLGKGTLFSTSGEWNSVGEEGEEGRERDEGGERGLEDCKDYVLVSFVCNAKELGLYFAIVMHY